MPIKLTKEEFITRAILIHGDKYGYGRVVYMNDRTKILIYCKKCKKYFEQTPDCHIHQKSGCSICRESKGEREIAKYLDVYNITYIQEKRFYDCRDNNPLPFDFYIEKYNICIEYQGEQYYKTVRNLRNKVFTLEESIKKLKDRKRKDKIKKYYCKNNNIKLIEIPYWKKYNIEQIIKDIINTYNKE